MKRKIIHYNPILKERARNLRNQSTKSEVFLWAYLKNKQRMGYDFHRQKPIGNYILDFYCNELKLGIEIDGSTHEDKYKYDQKRELMINSLGIIILRFDDEDVINFTEEVVIKIEQWIQKHRSLQ